MPNVTSSHMLLDAPVLRASQETHQFNVHLMVSTINFYNFISPKNSLPNWHYSSVEDKPIEHLSPCVPSPCGANAICKEQNGAGSCSCLPEYFGNPYEGCRPECIVNTDCLPTKACLNNKCIDPCPGTCGANAICQVVSHTPSCTCIPSYTGDPFRYCSPIPIPGIIHHHITYL